MRELTEREQRVLDFIVGRTREKGSPPTIREIGEAFQIASTNGVRYYLSALERKGYIARNRRVSRGIELVGGLSNALMPDVVQIPVLGRVAAGLPLLATENVEDTLVLDRSIVRDGTVFALTVQGESMKDAGILSGDKVLVRQQATAEAGEIVVALIDDEATVKRYRPEAGRIVLEAENPAFSPIIVEDDGAVQFSIVGRVIGVVRMYR